MSIQTLNNGATLLEQRTKINANFGELDTRVSNAYVKPPGGIPSSDLEAPVSGAGVSDATSLTLTTAHASTNRIPAGTQTYTVDASTGWSVSDGIAVWLPVSGTVSFAVSGGPTLNGGTSTLTRTLAGNSGGYVVLNRIAGTAAYSLSGA